MNVLPPIEVGVRSLDGKITFHVYLTPPSPAREITFKQEYDPDYISTLFA